MDEATPIAVTNNEAANRLEVHMEGLLAVAEYRVVSGTLTFTHTRVPQHQTDSIEQLS